HGDRYAGEWPAEQFRKHGITYEAAAKPKSDLYRDFLPLLNSGRVDLLDHPKLVNQIASLERRTARGGRDLIDHPLGGHDDLANSVAGLAVHIPAVDDLSWICGDGDPHIGGSLSWTERAEFARMRLWGHINSGRPPWSY